MNYIFQFFLATLLLNASISYAKTTHELAVGEEINAQLGIAFAKTGEIEVKTRIKYALGLVTGKRDEPGRSTDEVLRDAEYYLHGLYGASANDWSHSLPVLAAPIYNSLKWAALRCKDAGRPEFENMLRSNPMNPISEPGGSVWAYRGLVDGWAAEGNKSVPARPVAHGLSLDALNAVAPCVPRLQSIPLLGTRWSLTWDVANAKTTVYPIEFASSGRLTRINPANGVDDASKHIINTWVQNDSTVTFAINSGYTKFTGTFESDGVLAGEAKAASGTTWKWKAVRRP